MEKISEMIERLCPEGVEKVPLHSIVRSIHTGLNPRKNFKLNEPGATKFYVTVKEITSNKLVFSDSTDKITDEAWSIIQNRSHVEQGDVLFSGIGTIGKVVYITDPTNNWNCSESVFVIKLKKDLVNGQFLSYILKSNAVVAQYEACASGSIMKGVRKSTLESLEIPLPPLSIQQEIVRVLDSFTAMITNLETELASRQKQYEHYRNQLLTFDENDNLKKIGVLSKMIKRLCPEGVEKVRLDSVCSFTRGNTITAKNAIEGTIPVIAGGQTPSYYHNEANRIGDTVVIAGSGAYAGFVSYWQIPIYVSDAFSIDSKESLHKKYLFYFLKRNQRKIYETQKGAGVPHVHGKDIAGFEIPLPPLSVQQEIISILDTFELLITNIKLELEARKKQYEYYREKLLTFE